MPCAVRACGRRAKGYMWRYAGLLVAAFVLIKVLGSRDAVRRRNTMVFLSCVTMAVAIVFQILWPLWPYYALGCLVCNCFFHVFVLEDERSELRRAVIERTQAAKHMAEVEKALARARAAEKARSMGVFLKPLTYGKLEEVLSAAGSGGVADVRPSASP